MKRPTALLTAMLIVVVILSINVAMFLLPEDEKLGIIGVAIGSFNILSMLLVFVILLLSMKDEYYYQELEEIENEFQERLKVQQRDHEKLIKAIESKTSEIGD